MTLLDVKHVQKIYNSFSQGPKVGPQGYSHFTVEKGDYCYHMGESGSEIHSLLNILAMLDKPSRGQVPKNGTDKKTKKFTQAYSLAWKKIGFVFQDFNFRYSVC